jgi:acetylornithine aminotransferase
MLGVVLSQPRAKQLEFVAREHGVLVNAIGSDVIRLVPPLVLSDADVELLLERWPAILDSSMVAA